MKSLVTLLTKIGLKKTKGPEWNRRTKVASEAEKQLKEVARLGQNFILMELSKP